MKTSFTYGKLNSSFANGEAAVSSMFLNSMAFLVNIRLTTNFKAAGFGVVSP